MIGPEVQAPDFTEAVVAYRRFTLVRRTQHNFGLASIYQKKPWPTAEMRAKCQIEVPVPEGIVLPHPPKAHSAPHKDCGCGIYAYFDPCPVGDLSDRHRYMSFMREPGTEVSALVVLSGRIEVHARGMRAERAKVCALGINPNLSADERTGLAIIAQQFGAALVDEDDLPRIAPEYGSPLTESARPELPPSPVDPRGEPELLRYIETPPERSRIEHLPAAINVACAGANLTVSALVGFTPMTATSVGLSLGLAAFFDIARRRRGA